jgi:hypothetical protein
MKSTLRVSELLAASDGEPGTTNRTTPPAGNQAQSELLLSRDSSSDRGDDSTAGLDDKQ